MTEEVTQVDHAGEPRDRWHPEHDTFTEWLDTEAPVIEAKRRNQSDRHHVPKQDER